jgi:hypothetical protein
MTLMSSISIAVAMHATAMVAVGLEVVLRFIEVPLGCLLGGLMRRLVMVGPAGDDARRLGRCHRPGGRCEG